MLKITRADANQVQPEPSPADAATLPEKLDLNGIELSPFDHVVQPDALQLEVRCARAKHLAELGRLGADLNQLVTISLPRGYEPETVQFGNKGDIVEADTGLLPESRVRVSISYVPPVCGFFRRAPATLRASLAVGGILYPIASVDISAKGQQKLSSDTGWSHEQILLQVSEYVFSLCRDAETKARQVQAKANFIDFEDGFEARLVEKLAIATNLLALPEYYRAFADRRNAKEAIGGYSERLTNLERACEQELEEVRKRIAHWNSVLNESDAMAQLRVEAERQVRVALDEISKSLLGKAVDELENKKRALQLEILGLEDAIHQTQEVMRELQEEGEDLEQERSPERVKLRILGIVDQCVGSLEDREDMVLKLTEELHKVYIDYLADPRVDTDTFFAFLTKLVNHTQGELASTLHDRPHIYKQRIKKFASHVAEALKLLVTSSVVSDARQLGRLLTKADSQDPKKILKYTKRLTNTDYTNDSDD